MNDGGWGGRSPPGSLRRQEGGWERPAAPPPLGECSAPFLSRRLQLPWIVDWGGAPGGSQALTGAPSQRKTGGRAASGARGRGDLAGVSGLGCGGGGAASLVALSGLEQRPGNKEGRTGV